MSQVFRYVLVGVFNTGIGYFVIFSLMYGMGLSPLYSNVVGYGVGLFFSYFLNRIYTFKSKQKKTSEFLLFVLFFLLAYGVNLIVLYILIYYAGVHEAVSQLLAGAVYIACSFLLQKFFVYSVKYDGDA